MSCAKQRNSIHCVFHDKRLPHSKTLAFVFHSFMISALVNNTGKVVFAADTESRLVTQHCFLNYAFANRSGS